MEILYHGSIIELNVGDFLVPHSSYLLGGEKVVYATPWIWFATVIMAHINDNKLSIGTIDDEPYIEEKVAGALKPLEGMSGWIYTVNASSFHGDGRLMPHGESISDEPVKILKRQFVPNIASAILEMDEITIVYHEM